MFAFDVVFTLSFSCGIVENYLSTQSFQVWAQVLRKRESEAVTWVGGSWGEEWEGGGGEKCHERRGKPLEEGGEGEGSGGEGEEESD